MFGMGKMGSAMCERLCGLGHDVVAWNRTADRALETVERIVKREPSGKVLVAATPRHAMNALWYSSKSETTQAVALVVVSDSAAAEALLRGVAVPPNVTVVNVTSGSPDEVRAIAELTAGKYVDGAYSGPPEAARTGKGQLFVSASSKSIVDEIKYILDALGDVTFAGPIGAARALDYAVVDLAFVNLLSFCSSAAMLDKEGVDWQLFCDQAAVRLSTTPDALRAAARRMRSSNSDSDYARQPVATLATWRNFWASRLPYLQSSNLPEPRLAKFAIEILDMAGASDPNLAKADITRIQQILRFDEIVQSEPRATNDVPGARESRPVQNAKNLVAQMEHSPSRSNSSENK